MRKCDFAHPFNARFTPLNGYGYTYQNIPRPVRYQPTDSSFNEHVRLAERHLEFDARALRQAIATASNRFTSDIVSFFRMAEGGFDRLFEATFTIIPKHHTVASEVAALNYFRLHGIKANPQKFAGKPLEKTWYTMTPKQQHGIMKQIVEWETRLISSNISASGSLYYQKDIPSGQGVALPYSRNRRFCIGPMTLYGWWHGERATWTSVGGHSNEIVCVVGERALKWTKAYAKPRFPYECLYREIYNFNQVSSETHIRILTDYLTFPLDRPVIQHPRSQPIRLIDWQHYTIVCLGLAVGIPKHSQNYRSPESESLRRLQTNFPQDFDFLSPSAQASVRKTMRRRIGHFVYAPLTKRLNKEHYSAIFNQSVILHLRVYRSEGSPWEGDSVTLQAEMIRTMQTVEPLLAVGTATTNEFGFCRRLRYRRQAGQFRRGSWTKPWHCWRRQFRMRIWSMYLWLDLG
ncbi:hypothetical protein BDV19DRAFT_383653 [Aspergillus venezuelensis]